MSLKNGDLEGTIIGEISVDEFTPKSGEASDIIVVAFYATDIDPAEDLNTFIQRSFIDTIDVEVSPNTDADGRYLVFVEFQRNDGFPNKLQALIKDIENVSGKMKWKVKTYYSSSRFFDYNDPELYNFMILDPKEYVSKEDFKLQNIKEAVQDFFENSLALSLTINDNTVTIAGARYRLVTEVVDIGDYDTVIGRNFLTESAFGVGRVPHEAQVLQHIIGACQVLPIDKYLCVSKDDTVILLKNTQLI